jgi:hypothetical protein
LHAYGLTDSHGNAARVLLTGIELVEMDRLAHARALEPLPIPFRTLDALHLAIMDFLHGASGAVSSPATTIVSSLLRRRSAFRSPRCKSAAAGCGPR